MANYTREELIAALDAAKGGTLLLVWHEPDFVKKPDHRNVWSNGSCVFTAAEIVECYKVRALIPPAALASYAVEVEG